MLYDLFPCRGEHKEKMAKTCSLWRASLGFNGGRGSILVGCQEKCLDGKSSSTVEVVLESGDLPCLEVFKEKLTKGQDVLLTFIYLI